MSDSTDAVPASKSPLSNLTGRVVPAAALTHAERERLLVLMDQHYDNVQRDVFTADLREKDDVILLTDASTGQICGFSTMVALFSHVDGRPVTALFSGDTIIQPDYWGSTILPRLWARLAFGRAADLRTADPAMRVYWFLISGGYKTYRYLPLFFRTFYPTCERATPPDVQVVLDTLARQRYGDAYQNGVIRLAHPTPLRTGLAEVGGRAQSNPHVAFFLRANPGHAAGDELACLTEVLPENLTRAGARMLYG